MEKINSTLRKLAPAGPLVLRVILGGTMLAHGIKKFNDGISGTKGFFEFLSIPAPGFFAYVVALLEVIGGILVILGIATRVISVLFVGELLVAVFLFKYGKDVGFFDKVDSGAGAELDWALIAGFFMLAVSGPGSLSGDAKLNLEPAEA